MEKSRNELIKELEEVRQERDKLYNEIHNLSKNVGQVRPTKEEILAVKNTSVRQRLIADNMDLFN